MTIEVWGRATSSNVQAVMWTLAELGLDHVRHDRGHVHGGLDTPEYLAMNPHGLIPVIRDGGGPPIWESAAIVRYLGARYGDAAFWPRDPAARAQVDMWAEWIKLSFCTTFAAGVFWPLVRSRPEGRDDAAVSAATQRLAAGAKKLDARLAQGGPYLGGDALCFADIIAGHILHRYFDVEFPRAETPALAAYHARLTRRPAYRAHVMVSYDSLRA